MPHPVTPHGVEAMPPSKKAEAKPKEEAKEEIDEEDIEDFDCENEKGDKTKLAKEESKQLDSITDFHEDNDDTKVNTKEVEERLKELRKRQEEGDKKRLEKEKALAAVKVKKEDLDLLCAELPLCERDALNRLLQENGGNVLPAMRAAVHKFPVCA